MSENVNAASTPDDLINNVEHGDKLILEGRDGSYVASKPARIPTGSKNGWEVIDEDLNVHELYVIAVSGKKIEFRENKEIGAINNVANSEIVEDFEVVEKDCIPRIEKWQQKQLGKYSTSD